MEVQHYRLFPQALSTLVDLYDLKGDKNAPPVKLAIVYREPEGPDARIALSVAN
jgi:hypothetical protein